MLYRSPKPAIDIIASSFVLLFVYTGVSKLGGREAFETVLSHSPLLESLASALSWALPVAELLTALMLLVPSTRKAGMFISLLLMIIFTGYLCYMIYFTSKLPCACGGVLKRMTWQQHLVFNVVFTGIAALGTWLGYRNKDFIAINRDSRIPV